MQRRILSPADMDSPNPAPDMAGHDLMSLLAALEAKQPEGNWATGLQEGVRQYALDVLKRRQIGQGVGP